jgi:CRP-like cAMP-binding protein
MFLMKTEENHILQTLPKKEYETLLPELELVTLVLNQVLYTAHTEIEYGYFLNTGLISCLTVMRNDASVEVGLAGYQGFVGLPILLNIAQSSILVKVQIAGQAFRIKAERLHKLLPKLPMLERLLSRFAYLQLLESQLIAACNRLHKVEERLARWLLMSQDRVRLNSVPLTQEQLAAMLGTRRASVSEAARQLQRAGRLNMGGDNCGFSIAVNLKTPLANVTGSFERS